MNVPDIIRKKRDGGQLSDAEIGFLVRGISNGSIPDYQIAAWAMAVYFQGMDPRETRSLTLDMALSGEKVDLSNIEGVKVDKHSTGGVGDKTTLVVVPLVAAAGVAIAKMSGRGLGHTGGTIDKLESIPGFKVERTHHELIEQVNRVKAAVVAQSGNLVPADKRLYALRDVTATVDSIPLIASSIMSKKIAAGAQAIVLDVKTGRGAFMEDLDGARELAKTMVAIGAGTGRKVLAMLSDMSQPLGKTVGNALEVREAIDTLRDRGPADLEALAVSLAAHMLVLAGRFATLDTAKEEVLLLLKSGQGLAKFLEMVEAQGGRLDLTSTSYGLPRAPLQAEVKSPRSGFVAALDALEVGQTAMLLGAGREKLGGQIDHAVGIELLKKKGDYVHQGNILAVVHAREQAHMDEAVPRLLASYQLDEVKPFLFPLIIETVQ